jgi:hypothetical protein
MTQDPKALSKARSPRSALAVVVACALALALAACGGGGSGQAETPVSGALTCPAAPSGEPALSLAGVAVASLSADKAWLSQTMAADYLWPDEIPGVDPNAARFSDADMAWESLTNYFSALLTPGVDAQGRPQDRFSFAYPTQAWERLADGGVQIGYGVEWSIESPTPPRQVRVAYVMPGSPAALAGLKRGDRVLSVNGVSTDVNTSAGVATLVGALFPQTACATDFNLSRDGESLPPARLAATEVVKTSALATRVIEAGNGRKVGYVAFLEHFGDAEARMTEAFTQFQQARVDELVLDLRYNGGGYLYIASQVAYMVAGADRTRSKDFTRLQYNARRSADTADSNLPFLGTRCVPGTDGYCTSTDPLPQLALTRLYVLTSEATCSASESIVNGLFGIDVEVVLIGATTCGKPYGFTAKERSGISYFPIEFSSANHKGYSDYAYGFEPGCQATDDLEHDLGDTAEAMLATALAHQSLGRCPAGTMVGQSSVQGARRWAERLGLRPPVLGVGMRSSRAERILAERERRVSSP